MKTKLVTSEPSGNHPQYQREAAFAERPRVRGRVGGGGRGRYCLEKGLGFWRLTFAGQEAVFKHEQGADYVAYLLLNPPEEPIHALDLCVRMALPGRKGSGIAELVDPETGEVAVVEVGARVHERGMGLEDAATMRAVLRTQEELEAMLEDEATVEQVKRIVERELMALYEYEKKNSHKIRDSAQRAADAVGKAIRRFYAHLAEATEAGGKPHAVLRAFAEHLRWHLLVPSGRGCARGGPRPGAGLAGCFTYEAPRGIVWAQG
jgi:hypothetical protein